MHVRFCSSIHHRIRCASGVGAEAEEGADRDRQAEIAGHDSAAGREEDAGDPQGPRASEQSQ